MGIKLFLVSVLAGIYFLSTFCMLQKEICVYHADYYLLNNRSISWKDEREFKVVPIQRKLSMFTPYSLQNKNDEIKLLGFAPAEERGRWSVGNIAKVAFDVSNPHVDVLIKLTIKPYVNKYNPKIKVKVFANYKESAEWSFEQGENQPTTEISIPKSEFSQSSRVELTFKIEGIVSPKSLGYGRDNRKLGIFLSEILVKPTFDEQNKKKRIFQD